MRQKATCLLTITTTTTTLSAVHSTLSKCQWFIPSKKMSSGSQTSPPSFGPLDKHTLSEFVRCDLPNLFIDCLLKFIQIGKSPAPEMLFQVWIKPEIIRGKVGGVSWMGYLGHSKSCQQCLGVCCCVTRCIIHVQELPASDHRSGPSVHPGLVEPAQDGLECPLVDCLWPAHELDVDQAFGIEESDCHHLPSADCVSGFLRPLLKVAQPLSWLLFGLWVIEIHPTLIHGDDTLQDPGRVGDEPGPEVADVNPSLCLRICEQVGSVFCALLTQFQVLFQDVLDSGISQSSLQNKSVNGDPPVIAQKGFHSSDVGHGSACFRFGFPLHIHNSGSATLKLVYPMVDPRIT